MRSGLFATVAVATSVAGEDSDRAREFKGNGQPFLPVPGCKSVSKVFIGHVEIPQYVTHRFPVDDDAKNHVSADWPLWDLQQDPAGTPILLRSVQSNDGIWQEGATIVVVGEWEPEGEPTKKGSRKPAEEMVPA